MKIPTVISRVKNRLGKSKEIVSEPKKKVENRLIIHYDFFVKQLDLLKNNMRERSMNEITKQIAEELHSEALQFQRLNFFQNSCDRISYLTQPVLSETDYTFNINQEIRMFGERIYAFNTSLRGD